MCAEFFSNRKLQEISESQAAREQASQDVRMKQRNTMRASEKLRILYLAPGCEETSFEAEYSRSIALKLQDSGEKVCRLPFPRGAASWLSYFFGLIRQIPRSNVIHLSYTHAGTFSRAIAPALVLAKFFGKPTALYLLAPDSELLIYRWISGPFLRAASLVVAPDNYLCQLLKDIGAPAISVPPTPAILSQPPERVRQIQPRVLVTDPFALPEGPRLALQVFAHVKEKYPRTEMTFCVDRAERQLLNQSNFDISGVETIHCECDEDRQKEFLRHDVYLQTPGYDNSHLKLFEALAAGIPVVSSNPGGVEEFVSDRIHAHVVDGGDHVALAERIIELVEIPAAGAELAASGFVRAQELGAANPAAIWRRIYDTLALHRSAPEMAGDMSLEPVKRGM